MSRLLVASRCSYATSISNDNRMLRPSAGDHQPERRIPGHPDNPSSILDTSPLAPTGRTRTLEHEIDSAEASTQALQSELGTHIAARTGGVTSDPSSMTSYYDKPQTPDITFSDFGDFQKQRTKARQNARSGTRLVQTYDPLAILKTPPTADDITLPMLLANQTHLGHHTSLWNPANSSYIFGIREGIHIISLRHNIRLPTTRSKSRARGRSTRRADPLHRHTQRTSRHRCPLRQKSWRIPYLRSLGTQVP